MSMYLKLYSKAEHMFSYLPTASKKLALEYIQHKINRQFSPMTIYGTIIYLKNFFEYLPKEKLEDFSQIIKSDIRQYIQEGTERNLKARSINRILSTLKGFFAYLVDEEYLDKSPVLSQYYVEQEKRLPRPMDEGDLRLFLANIKAPMDRSIFLLMLRCGLRIGELCRLKVADVNFEKKNLIVHNGKGKVDRVVYFSNDAGSALDNWLRNYRKIANEYCFPSSHHKDSYMCSVGIRKRMKHILEKCGLEKKSYTPHTLRHTFATILLNADVPLVTIKELMGHKSFDETLRYAKLFDQKIRESYTAAIEKITQKAAENKEKGSELSETI